MSKTIHFPGSNANPPALSARDGLLALVVEALQGMEESLFILSEYTKRKAVAEKIFAENEFPDEPEGVKDGQ